MLIGYLYLHAHRLFHLTPGGHLASLGTGLRRNADFIRIQEPARLASQAQVLARATNPSGQLTECLVAGLMDWVEFNPDFGDGADPSIVWLYFLF